MKSSVLLILLFLSYTHTSIGSPKEDCSAFLKNAVLRQLIKSENDPIQKYLDTLQAKGSLKINLIRQSIRIKDGKRSYSFEDWLATIPGVQVEVMPYDGAADFLSEFKSTVVVKKNTDVAMPRLELIEETITKNVKLKTYKAIYKKLK